MTENNSKSNNELQIILEGIQAGRLQVESIQKRELSKKKTKYTIIVNDQAVIEKEKTNTKKAKEKTKTKEKPVQKIITKEVIEPKSTQPAPATRPAMAEISRVGGY